MDNNLRDWQSKMAKRKSSSTREDLDFNNPANWAVAQLKDALKSNGIIITANLSQKCLKKIYLDNVNKDNGHVNTQVSDSSNQHASSVHRGINSERHDLTQDNSMSGEGTSTETSFIPSLLNVSRNPERDAGEARRNLPQVTTPTSSPAQTSTLDSAILSTLQMCQQTFQSVQQNINSFNKASSLQFTNCLHCSDTQ